MKNHPYLVAQAALVLALAAALPAAHAADSRAAARYYEDALVRYEKKDVAGAIVQLKNALQADAKVLPAHVLLGKALLDNGEVNAAEVAFDEALRLGVNRAEVVLPLAAAVAAQGRPQDLLQQERFADAGLPAGVRAQLLVLKAGAAGDSGTPREAVQLIEAARAIDPSRADTWVAEVPLRLRAGQVREALAAADQAVHLAPSSADAQYQRGTVSHLQGDLKAALQYYSRAIELRPQHADALASRAGVLVDLGRHGEARADVAALRAAAPRDARGAYLAALQAERTGDTAAVRRELAEVTAQLDVVPLEFMRFRPQLLLLGGLAHLGLDEPEKAKPYLETAQRRTPGSPVAKLLAQTYLREKNPDRAAETLDAYLRARPHDTQAALLLASVYVSQGRHARAATLMQEAAKRQDDPAVRSMLGMSLLGSGKLASGAAELEAAFKRDPRQVQAGAALATLYLHSNQVDKALAVVDTLLRQQPGNASLHHLAGTARWRKGDAPGARAAFQQAVKLAPDFAAPQIALARADAQVKAWDAALRQLSAVLARDEKNVEAMRELARIERLRGRPAEALRWHEKAFSVAAPGNLQPGLQLVDHLLETNQPGRARPVVKALHMQRPDSLAVLLVTARVELANRDAAAARATLNRLTAMAQFDPAILVQAATLQLRADNVAGAYFALDKALGERPDHLHARALMADVLLRQGDVARAEQLARGIVASHPKAGVGHALLGDVALARKQRPQALEAYRRAHDLDRNSASLLRLFGALAAADAGAALQAAEQWLRVQPGDVAVRRAVADTHARAGNLPAARAAYEAVVKAAPDDVEALNNLANVQLLQGDKSALQTAERALALSPDSPHVIGTAGWVATRSGQVDRGLQLLRDARLRDPNNADTRYFLGAALAERGRTMEARSELEGAVQSTPATSFRRDAEMLLSTLK